MGKRCPLLRIYELSKSYGNLPALKNLNLEIYPGEVVGLTGQSGSGKSVLNVLIAGIEVPDSGVIHFDGKQLTWPYWARSLGIEFISQEPILADNLDIIGNILLGYEAGWPTPGKLTTLLNQSRMGEQAKEILNQLDVQFESMRQPVTNLTSEQRQLVAIAKTMIRPAKLLLVDDPFALLNYRYQQKLLSLIQVWQEKGTTIIFNSRNLDHLFAVTDRILVLNLGELVADYQTDQTTREAIVAASLGTANRTHLTPTLWALDSYYKAKQQAERLSYQQQLLKRNLEAQDSLNQQLIEELTKQVKALNRANMALQDAQRRSLTEREEERKRLARELHDQLIQDLLSVNYQLENLETDDTVDLDLLPVKRLEKIRYHIRTSINDLRQICKDLRPPVIDSLGLGIALQSYSEDWSERASIKVNLNLDPNLEQLPEDIELSVFRIIQESLSNVYKHSTADEVDIELRHTSPRMLLISIVDNGQGVSEDFNLSALAAKGHYGLLGISERIALLGGRLKMQNHPERGFHLQAEIPHPRVHMLISVDHSTE